MKRIAVLIIMMMWAWSLFAQPQLAYHPMDNGEGDSLGVKVENGQTFMRYRMGSGETVMMVCRKYSVSLASVASANPGVNPDLIQVGQVIYVPRPSGNTTTTVTKTNGNYTVNPGETLTAICNKFGVSMSSVIAANPGLNPDLLQAGQSLTIPGVSNSTLASTAKPASKKMYDGPTDSYAIEKGETLYSIARKYGVSFADLMSVNPNIQPEKIYPGQVITVPMQSDNSVVAQQSNTPKKEIKQEKETDSKEEAIVEKKEVPVEAKKEIPVFKKVEPIVQKEEPIVKKEEPAVQKEEPVIIKEEPIILKEDPIAINNHAEQGNEMKETPVNAMKESDSGELAVAEGNNMLLTAGKLDKDKPFAQVFTEYTSNGNDSKSEKGVATWIEGASAFGNSNERIYALHNNAPIGSVIKVRNMMNNRVIYAKVIGTLSEEEVNDKVLVKLTAGAAETLNVLDSRFVSEITYYKVGKDFLR